MPPTAQDKVEDIGFKVSTLLLLPTISATHHPSRFLPVILRILQSKMGSRLSLLTSTCKLFPLHTLHISQCIYASSLSVQVITRGANPAGYGFVSLRTEEAVHKAVQTLNKKELDGRQVIVEIAKPADQKDRRERRFFKRRPGRRGGKAVPGEVTEAEANGEALKTEAVVPGTDEAVKPKKKKKKIVVSHFCACFC